jgi:hypothetical protein
MKELERLKEKFLELFPREEDVWQKRYEISGGRCEFSGEESPLEMHHLITGKNRRSFFERVFTVRMVNDNSHKGKRKGEMIAKFRKELSAELQKQFTDSEVRTIIGKTKI